MSHVFFKRDVIMRTGFVLEPAGPVPLRARPRRGEAEAHRQRDGGHPGHLSLQVGGEHVPEGSKPLLDNQPQFVRNQFRYNDQKIHFLSVKYCRIVI